LKKGYEPKQTRINTRKRGKGWETPRKRPDVTHTVKGEKNFMAENGQIAPLNSR